MRKGLEMSEIVDLPLFRAGIGVIAQRNDPMSTTFFFHYFFSQNVDQILKNGISILAMK